MKFFLRIRSKNKEKRASLRSPWPGGSIVVHARDVLNPGL